MLPDRKLPSPFANVTLLNAHSAIQSIQGAPLARPPSSNSHTSWLNQLQLVTLLERHIPGFDLNNLDEISAHEGLEIDSNITTLVGYHNPTPLRPGESIPPKLPHSHLTTLYGPSRANERGDARYLAEI